MMRLNRILSIAEPKIGKIRYKEEDYGSC